MRSVIEWLVRRLWPALPAIPIIVFAAIVLYVGTCNRHLPCHPIELALPMPSENAIPYDVSSDPAYEKSIVWTFRYAPTGTEAGGGVPYWIFRALPRLFPEEFAGAPPGQPWDAFGLVSVDDPKVDRKSAIPRGLVVADTDYQLPGVELGFKLKRVAINCSGCHQGEYLDDQDQRHMMDGAPNAVADHQRYKSFIHHALASPKFTVDNVLAAVDAELESAGADKLTTFERVVYTQIIKEMQSSGEKPGTSWMDKRPMNGPGRIDAFSAVKYETLHAPDDGHLATVDLPSVWNQRRSVRPWHHWDGNTDDLRARNYGSVVGVGGTATSVRGKNVDAVGTWLDYQLGPPAFPFARPGTNPERLQHGRDVFKEKCATCHGMYDAQSREVATSDAPFYMTTIELPKLGTDPLRTQAFDAPTATLLNQWGFDRGIWRLDAFRPIATGYLAPPLDGIWARAPYLHDGSVPTLRALLSAPDKRPKAFYRGSRRYDPNDMGWEWKEPHERGTNRELFRYDTSLPGNNNSGHEFYVADGDVDAVLDYLASL
ncbi:MAG TPA: hypothetical protein VL463_21270 [Kofleriaceae bacterium]|nr:hypothetical protein [Kofleriaceae bacterium]